MRRYDSIRGLVVIALLLLNFREAHAQPILIGCTSFLNSSPQSSKLVDIDPFTGVGSNPRDTGIIGLAGIATEPATGILYGLTSFVSTPVSSLIRINPVTGAFSTVGATGVINLVEGDLAFNPANGSLYGLQGTGPTNMQRNLFALNTVTGAATVMGSLSSGGDYSAMAFSSAGTLFVIDSGATGNSLLSTVDPSTGTIINTVSMNFDLGSSIGMTFDPQNGLCYVSDGAVNATGLLFTMNTTTGVLTPIGPTGVFSGVAGLSFVSVPEPSSLILSTVGALVVARLTRLGKRDIPLFQGQVLGRARPSEK